MSSRSRLPLFSTSCFESRLLDPSCCSFPGSPEVRFLHLISIAVRFVLLGIVVFLLYCSLSVFSRQTTPINFFSQICTTDPDNIQSMWQFSEQTHIYQALPCWYYNFNDWERAPEADKIWAPIYTAFNIFTIHSVWSNFIGYRRIRPNILMQKPLPLVPFLPFSTGLHFRAPSCGIQNP